MKFEVINSVGRCMQSTEYPECIPYDMLDNMAAHGYKFRVDGKIIPKTKVRQVVDNALVGLTAKEESVTTIHAEAEVVVKTSTTRGKPPISIICIEDGITFNSQSDAAKYYGISAMSVSKSVKTGKPVKGHTFKGA